MAGYTSFEDALGYRASRPKEDDDCSPVSYKHKPYVRNILLSNRYSDFHRSCVVEPDYDYCSNVHVPMRFRRALNKKRLNYSTHV